MPSFPTGYHPLEQSLIRCVVSAASAAQLDVYLVGGYVRDALLARYGNGVCPLDFDYAVSGGSAIDFARCLCRDLNGHFVILNQELDTARIVLDSGEMLDFAGCVGGDIRCDIVRRDFTINALFWDPKTPGEVFDLIGGLQDLSTLTIRAINEQNFVDDPLRILRAFRFSTTLGGNIDSGTTAMICKHAALLTNAAPERISYELFTIVSSSQAAKALRSMGELGILEIIFPELAKTRTVTANTFHHLDLWDHSLTVVEECERALAKLPQWVHDNLSFELSAGISRLQALKIAGVLHDIGKPGTWQITPAGRHTFLEHDRLGAEMCDALSERLRWSKAVSRFVSRLVRWHLRPGQLFHQGPPTERAILRFFRTIGNDVPALMVLAFGDLGATHGPGLQGPRRDALHSDLTRLLDQFNSYLNSKESLQRLLNGNEIMQLLGIGPGPVLGEMLEAISEAQDLKEIHNRADAKDFVLSLYRDRYVRSQ